MANKFDPEQVRQVDSNTFNLIVKHIQSFIDKDLKELTSTPQSELGSIYFSDLEPDFYELKELFIDLDIQNLYLLPRPLSVETIDVLLHFFRMLKENIFEYKMKLVLNEDQRNKIRTDAYNMIRVNISSTLKPQLKYVIPYIKANKLIKTLDSNLMLEQIEKSKLLISELNDIKKDATDIRTTIQEELNNIGLGAHTKIFSEDAKTHSIKAAQIGNQTKNLIFITLIIILGILAIFLKFSNNWSTRQIIEIGAISAIIISMLTFSITLLLKNYFAEKHLQTINQHKANVLGTFLTLSNISGEPTKYQLLEQAINAIFAQPITGFINKENEVQNPNPIVNIVDGISKKFE